MKKTISITVDMDTWLVAKEKVSNISKYLNECLYGLTGRNNDYKDEKKLEEEIKYYKTSIQELFIKQTIAQESLKILEEAKALKAKTEAEDQQFKRWVCPICKQQNYLSDDFRCTKCNMPTRNESKTKIISIKDEVILDG